MINIHTMKNTWKVNYLKAKSELIKHFSYESRKMKKTFNCLKDLIFFFLWFNIFVLFSIRAYSAFERKWNVLCRQWIFRAKSKINVIASEGCYKCIKWHKSYTLLNAKKYIQALSVGGQINSYRTAYKNVRFTSHKT